MGNTVSNDNAPSARFLAGCPPIPPSPDEADVQGEFDSLLRRKQVNDTVLEELNAMEMTGTKWLYCCLDKFLATPEAVNTELLDPRVCVQEILDPQRQLDCLHDLFRAVRINMLLRPNEWIKRFVQAEGVQTLVGLLDPAKGVSDLVHVEALNALFALSHSTHGMSAMVGSDACCQGLLGLYTTSSCNIQRGRVLKLLGVLCGHSQAAHSTVVSAIARRDGPKYGLFSSSFLQSENDLSFQLAVLTFINIVANTTTDTIERAVIRDDLEKAGVISTLEKYQGEGGERISTAMTKQIQTLLTSHTNDQGRTGEPPVQRCPFSADVPIVPSVVIELPPATVVGNEAETTPQREGPRSLTARKSLRLEMAELHTETEEVHGAPLISPPPAPEPIQRRPSGSLLPSLSIPKLSVAFSTTKASDNASKQSAASACATPRPEATSAETSAPQPPQPQSQPSLESILSMLQQGTKSLDEHTSQKLLSVLSKLATSITAEGMTACGKVVDKLEQSLAAPDAIAMKSSPAASPAKLSRISLRLPTRYSDSDVYALAVGTPAKSNLAGSQYRHFHGEDRATPTTGDQPSRSPTHSHYEEEHSPRRSMTETESCDESSHEYEMKTKGKLTSSAKGALAGFFQHLKKGQGLPTTPAPTPMATDSVKKDARRPVFPSFGSSSAAPSPMPGGHFSGSFALPPLTPLKTAISVSLPALTPVRPQVLPMAMSMSTLLSPRSKDEHLEAVKEEEAEPPSPVAAASASTGPDITKFRKLLAMGAPKAAVRAKMQQAGLDPDLLDRAEQDPAPVVVAPTPLPPVVTATPQTGLDISKFRKLLSMGAPLAAVKAKMQQAGLDPALLDQAPATAPPATLPAALLPKTEHDPVLPSSSSTKIKDDPTYSKFFKLRSMGAPAEAVKAKMRQAGVNPDYLDTPDMDMPSVAAPAPAPASATPTAPPDAPTPAPAVKVRDDPDYAKFFKLLSMGAPAAAVKAKMQQAGVNPDLLDTPDAIVPSKQSASNNNNAPEPSSAVKVRDDPDYAKFFKLLSMGAPATAVKAKMRQAGLDPDLLDTPDAIVPSKQSASNNNNATEPAAAAPKQVLVKDHPDYAKFFKLKTMAPVEVVKAKMRQAGLDPDLLDTPDAEMPTKGSGPETQSSNQTPASNQPVVLVKDDPAYAKFFKLVAMGAPADTVKGKMQVAGLRPELLDTPDVPLSSATGSNSETSNNAGTQAVAAAPAARRANLTLSIKPPSAVAKPTTRPLYWQHLKGDAIRGTIWEEIEKEQTKDNNERPLCLGDSDLGLLENEFPAQTAPATGPGKQTRSLSMDQMPKELLSPRVVFLIDRGRANNISIIIKQFRMSHAAIREAIMKADANVLTLERAQGLIKILPTDEEVAAIAGYQGDPLSLNEAERVLKELITVPRLKQRLTAMQSRLQFPQLLRDLQVKIDKLRTACNEVGQSCEFKTILQVVLQVGNKLNQGTPRGGAKGFRLGDLPKLSQLKAADKTSTLLHYVARMIRQKKGNAVRLSESLSSLYDVQNIPIPELPADMSKVAEIVDYVTNEVGAQKLKNAIEEKEVCDHFVKIMGEFLATAATATGTLKADLEAMVRLLKETMQRFGFQGDSDSDGDAGSGGSPDGSASANHAALTSAGEFFTIIYEFSVALTKADRENEVKRLREEARARQSLAKPKTPALGPRSMSSRDMIRKPALVEKKRDLVSEPAASPGPETQDKTSSGNPADPRTSPMLRQRSASLSSIVENNVNIEAILSALPAKSPSSSTSSMEKPSGAGSIEKKTASAGSDAVKEKTPEAKPSSIKPPTKFVKPSGSSTTTTSLSGDSTKPRHSIPLPSKIIKNSSSTASPKAVDAPPPPPKSTDFSVCYDSPLGLTMPETLGKAKPKPEKPEFDEFTPFDMTSIEDIRAQLVKKHVTPDGNNNETASSTGSSKLPSQSSPEESTAEIDLYSEAFDDDA